MLNFDGIPWSKSGALLGNSAHLICSTDPTTIGEVGQSCLATITSIPSTSNFLTAYSYVSGLGAVTAPDVGSWPASVVARGDIIWGVHAVGNVTANLVFNYSQLEGVNSPELIRLLKRADGSSEWVDVTASFIHDTASRTFTILGNSSFSEYSVGSEAGDNSLPVELSEFSAAQQLKAVSLKWVTDSEVENLGFILDRSERPSTGSGRRSEVATYLTHEGLGGQGSSNEAIEYQFVDNDVQQGQEYVYYLYDVDYSGQTTFLDSVAIAIDDQEWERIPEAFSLGMLFPNPFNPQITIPLALPELADVQLVIYDLRGREVVRLANGPMQAGRHQLSWMGNNHQGKPVASGIYILRCQMLGQESGQRLSSSQKILKLE
jgi:hypothetical protein